MAGMDAVVTSELCKRYGRRTVLQHVNLRVPGGSLFGFLGPNGAGKTTTLRILLGLLRADGGAALIHGRDAWRDGPRVRADIGYLPGDVRFYPHMNGQATLDFLGAGRGGADAAEIERLAGLFELDLRVRVRHYSRGMFQKLGLIQAMMHRPRLLVLDEPTLALDPLMRHALYGELQRFAAEGRTILFSSHTLSEVEQLCDHVAILRDGRVIEQNRIDVLRGRAVRHVEIVFPEDEGGTPPAGMHVARRVEGRLEGTWKGDIQPLLDWLSRARVTDVIIAPPSLEDLFLAYYAEPPGRATS
jgi:ABC-2 type transport system ATP-binding protein